MLNIIYRGTLRLNKLEWVDFVLFRCNC